ncbi:MAG: FAD-dependent oxidoreductase, partial [Nitrospiria bacterium]
MERETPSEASENLLTLGIEGFSYSDLYDPGRLAVLTAAFDEALKTSDPTLFERFSAYRDDPDNALSPPEEAELLIQVAFHQSEFIARLFNVSAERDDFMASIQSQKPLFRFKKEFVQKRALKNFSNEDLARLDYDELNEKVRLLINLLHAPIPEDHDSELLFAETACLLLDAEKALELKIKRNVPVPDEIIESIADLHRKMSEHVETQAVFKGLLECSFDPEKDADVLSLTQSLLTLLEEWIFVSQHLRPGECVTEGWDAFRTPHKFDFQNLVEIKRPDPDFPELIIGPEKTLRKRDGFELTDRRYSEKQVLSEIDYCVICHPREKDSCRVGLKNRKTGELEHNPLGIELTGCPLDERISEMHYLHAEGDAIAALAMVVIDNPMVPATGHRICNDCMKGCIYQKKDPVNIPQAETRILTDVLDLPYGFEIYALLTRWNPLNVKRPHALPYNGKNVLVVGMGPAGFTLAQFLLNEGFGVVGLDGLKIEPLPKAWVGDDTTPPMPIKDVSRLYHELDERVLAGFGGVSEYGITVRWDKNFLDVIHLTLARRNRFQVYGGVRFGGTVTADDAWALGFDHVAIAAGAGKPTLLWMKNNLIRGIRKASDFLMALQLTGAFKKSSLANLQLRLPAIIIGGGLTAIDTATEAMAYYPVQVEKALDQYEKLSAKYGEAAVLSMYDDDELEILQEFLTHGKQVRAERARAEAAGEPPNFVPLLRGWGGVSLVYRRDVLNSPAYRLNHEEVIKSLEEGIHYIELLSPTEAIPDQYGAVSAMKFEKQRLNEEGKLRGTGEFMELPAKTVLVAAGTSPNVIYEKEHPGTFEMDDRKKFFKRFQPEWNGGDAPRLVPSHDWTTPAVFTSYEQEGKFITFYGDNHPVYAGNVVKAMASAKKGYPYIVRLFEKDLARLTPEGQPARDAAFSTLIKGLDEKLRATVVDVIRLTPTIIEVIVKAPFQAAAFEPGQFYRLQNYESHSETIDGICL